MAVEVSRQDVVAENLVDIDKTTRFLKLPVAPYLEML